MNNKKGSAVIPAFIIGFVALLFVIFLGITCYCFSLINGVLGQDVEVGQVNLQNITNATFGQISTGVVNNADTIGIIFLFGMVLLMLLNAYFTAEKFPKIFFIVDTFLLAMFFIPSIYISQIYSIFINSSTVFQDTFINTIPKSSKFMLNLPNILATAGVVSMILSYSGINQANKKGDVNVGGY